jgi:hypothetical protein
LTLRHRRSTKTLSRQAPLPSMLMAMVLLTSTPVKAVPLNWLHLVRVEDIRFAMASERSY